MTKIQMMTKECNQLIWQKTFAYGTSKDLVNKNKRLNVND